MQIKEKARGVLFRHRFALFFFIYVVLYNWLVVNRLQLWQATKITYAYHIVDYSLGFRSQLLPGAIFYGLFGEHASTITVSIYETVLLLLFFAGLSVFLEKFLQGVEARQRFSAFILILVYLSGAFTFAIFTDELGMLDVYWLFFSLLFFLFLEKRGLRFLIPFLFVLSLLVHFSSVLSYIILFSILLLYKTSVEKKEKKPFFIIFIVSLVLSFAVFICLLISQSRGMPISLEDFNAKLESRGGQYYAYYDYAFYNYNIIHNEQIFSVSTASPVLHLLSMILEKCRFCFKMYSWTMPECVYRFALTALLLSPAIVFAYSHLHRFMKNLRDNRLQRFCVFLMMVQFPFTAIFGCLFSPDVIRWVTHAFLVFFTMLLYLLYHEETLRAEMLEDLDRLRKEPLSMIWFLAYFFTHSWAYC